MKLFTSATVKLTFWYLALIMVISVSFSVALYSISAREFDREMPPDLPTQRYQLFQNDQVMLRDIFRERAQQSRANIIGSLVIFNCVTLALGGVASFLFARRTLQPIENAMRAQGRFVSDASHELRTPLAVIQAENEVALRDKKMSAKSLRTVVASNLEEIEKLRALSDRLLKLSRDEKVDLTRIDIEQPAIDAVGRIVNVAQAKNISIENTISSKFVRTNAESLTDILVILLDNAIKYSAENSQIEIGVVASNRVAKLYIRDHGVGISPDDLPHVFDQFYRAESSRTSDGYGLGLALAQRLAGQIGTKIHVDSEVGKGSTFSITFPILARK